MSVNYLESTSTLNFGLSFREAAIVLKFLTFSDEENFS